MIVGSQATEYSRETKSRSQMIIKWIKEVIKLNASCKVSLVVAIF